jgi:hypothetical protein
MTRKRLTGRKLVTPKVKKLKALSVEKSDAERLVELLNSDSWLKMVQPLIDKMIRDTIGGIDRDGLWSSGIVGQPEGKNYSTDYLLGYRMGLIDFNNRLRTQQSKVVKIKKQIEELQKPATQNTGGGWSYMPQIGVIANG